METEALKKIAEALGYMIHHTKSGVFEIGTRPDSGSWIYTKFNPENNPAQLLEITEKFKIELKHTENEVWSKICNRGVWMPYKTLTEAILNAAKEFVNGT